MGGIVPGGTDNAYFRTRSIPMAGLWCMVCERPLTNPRVEAHRALPPCAAAGPAAPPRTPRVAPGCPTRQTVQLILWGITSKIVWG
ncbi:hypothetical protein ACFV23_56060, partial [Streptomyces sp. NPDC059627]